MAMMADSGAAAADPAGLPAAAPPAEGVVESSPPAPAGGPIRSREEAYYRLAEVADYLFRTEPHSPTPYLIRRAIAWGNLQFHELLLELGRGRTDLSAVFDLLGMNTDQTSSKGGGR